jgi:hypothetical protein
MTICKNYILPLLIIVTLASCSSSSMRIMATWVNKEKVATLKPGKHTVFVFVITQNYDAQVNLENDLAKAAEARGVKVIKSINAFGAILTQDKLPPKDAILKSVRNMGCDAIFTVALVDQHSETHYTPGNSGGAYYSPYPGYGYAYSGYYAYSIPIYSPGYYTTDKTYFIESNLFDADSEQMLVSMQSKVVNPPTIEKASKKYTEMLVTELQAKGFLKN